jgi:hypothetical protein
VTMRMFSGYETTVTKKAHLDLIRFRWVNCTSACFIIIDLQGDGYRGAAEACWGMGVNLSRMHGGRD